MERLFLKSYFVCFFLSQIYNILYMHVYIKRITFYVFVTFYIYMYTLFNNILYNV